MAAFSKFKITNKGLNYLNRSVAEKKALTFTKFKIGDGVPSGNWEELNDIVASFKEFPVLETSVQNNKVVRIKGYFDNKGLNADKKLKEIGVYATLEGVPEEILYSYTNAEDTADTVPDENNGFFSRTFDVANYIGNATQVTYTVEQITKDFDFNTIQEMQNATFLKAGDRVHLWGKTQLGDTTTKTLIVTDTYNGGNDKYTLKNSKIAVVINDIDNKLDKGTYTGNAQDLKNEIDKKQNKSDNLLKTKAKNIVNAINEIIPSNQDQTYSAHYFHNVYENYENTGDDYIFEHAYPMRYQNNTELLKRKSVKELRLLNGSGNTRNPFNVYTFTADGKIIINEKNKNLEYQLLSQKNFNNHKVLWQNSSGVEIQNRTVTLNEYLSNYSEIMFEVSNIINDAGVDYNQIILNTGLIRTNDTATADNQGNDYAFTPFQDYGYKTIYFRDDRRNIYVGEIYKSSPSVKFVLQRIIGINKVEIGGQL